MKIYLMIWLFVNGVDVGPPAMQMGSLEECQAKMEEILAKGRPEGASRLAVACARALEEGEEGTDL